MVEADNVRQKYQHRKTDEEVRSHDEENKVLCIPFRLLIPFRAHCLPHHGYHGQGDGAARNHLKGTDGSCHRVGGNGGRTKAGDQPRHKKLTALKEAVFHSHGNSDPHDPPDDGRMEAQMKVFVDAQRKLRIPDHPHQNDCRGNS